MVEGARLPPMDSPLFQAGILDKHVNSLSTAEHRNSLMEKDSEQHQTSARGCLGRSRAHRARFPSHLLWSFKGRGSFSAG